MQDTYEAAPRDVQGYQGDAKRGRAMRVALALGAVVLGGCAGTDVPTARSPHLTSSQFDALFTEYSQAARVSSALPDCPKGRDDLWRDCFGTIVQPDGSRYTGEIGHVPTGVPRLLHMLWPGGSKPWGKRSGVGVYVSAAKRYRSDRYLFFGQWANNFKHGFGRVHSSDGHRYVGFHLRDRRNGEGIEYGASGSILNQGRWSEGELASVYELSPSLFTYGGKLELPVVYFSNDDYELTFLFSPGTGASDARRGVPDRIAGRVASPPGEHPPQTEPTRSTLSLASSVSSPDSNGVVTLTINTGGDTASLKINGDEAGSRADGRYTLKRFAQVGDNKFEVIATDRFGRMQSQTLSVSRELERSAEKISPLDPLAVRAVKPRDAVAIIIGIEKYRSVSTADFANRDASIFVDYATRALGIPTQNIRLLVDEKAGAAEILLTFKNWLPTRVSKGKTDVYVFYSGHGLPSEDGNSLYFLPHEANRDLLDRTAITQKEVVDALQRALPKTVTMFIDSCYSGQSRTGETLLASARPIAVAAKQATSFPPNFTVLSASAPDQISSSSPDLRHGIFSYYLMRGMEGEADTNMDKQITVAEMQAYLAENVTKRALGMNRTQQPQVLGDQSRVLVGK